MSRLIFLLLFFGTANGLFACICWSEELTPKVFSSYDFIAHIRVKYAGTSLGPWQENFRHNPHNQLKYILFETVRHYQGPEANWMIEGSAFSSCAMGISANQEWMIYGTIDKKGVIYAHSCTNSGLYRLATGESSYRGAPGLKYAEQYCGYDPIFSLDKSGPDTIYHYFPNGQVEIVEPYYNGKKHGERRFYHPNGQLMLASHFDTGTICGRASYFNSNGAIEKVEIHNNTGHLIAEESFDETGQITRKTSYQTSSWKNRQLTYYYQNGLPYQIDHFDSRDLRAQKIFSPVGKLIYHATFSEDKKHTILVDLREKKTPISEEDF